MPYSFLKRLHVILKDSLTGYLSTSLGDYYQIASNRYLAYLLVTLIAGAWTFFALTLFNLTKPWTGIHHEMFRWTLAIKHSEMFRWTYTIETALNFGLSYYVLNEWLSRATGRWGRFANRTVGKTWLIWSVAFLFAFMMQLTYIHSRVDIYYPKLINFFDIYPAHRPGANDVFLFLFPSWLITICVLTWTCLRRQRAIDLERSEFDHMLNLREQEWAARYQSLITNSMFASSDPMRERNFTGEPIQVPDGNGSRWIYPEQISHVSVEDHYSRIFIKDHHSDKEMLIKRPLKKLLDQLPQDLFLQIHRSHVINLFYISQIKKEGRSYTIFLDKGNHALPLSRYRIPQILPRLQAHLSLSPGLAAL